MMSLKTGRRISPTVKMVVPDIDAALGLLLYLQRLVATLQM